MPVFSGSLSHCEKWKEALHSTITYKVKSWVSNEGCPLHLGKKVGSSQHSCLIANICLLSALKRVIKFPVRVLRETMPKPRNITRSRQREIQNQGGEEWPPCAHRRYRVYTRLVLLGAVWWFLSPTDQKTLISVLWPSKLLMCSMGMTSLPHTRGGENGLLVAKGHL